MKTKHLLAFGVLATMANAVHAQIAAGDYFIQNVESGAYLNGANDWGTKASATKHGQKMGVAVSGEGYTIDSRISNGGNSHYVNQGENLFVDGAAVAHTITDLGDGVYTVQSPNGDYLVQEGAYVNFKPVEVTDAAKWKFLSMDDMFKTLDEATAENPVDATFFVDDANFSRNNTLFSAWKGGPAKGGENTNMCSEAYNKSFDVYQTVSGVPAGFYKVYCQGFFRYGFAGNAQDNYGSEDMSLFPILYANDSEAPLQAVLNEETLQAIQDEGITTGTWSEVTVNGNAYKIPNNMNAASACFSAGLYSTSLDVKVGETGAIKMGFKKTAGNNPDGNWTIFDNFEIYFYGIDVEAAKAAIAALQGEATALYDSPYLSAAAKSALETAVSESNLSAAPKASEVASKTTALQNAIKEAEEDIAANTQIAKLENPQAGDDLTFALVNPSFETGNMNGWTNNSVNGMWTMMTRANATDPKVGDYWIEKYSVSGKLDIQQTVNLPRGGHYQVSVVALDQASKTKLVANSAETAIVGGDKATYTVDVMLDDNSDLTLGLYCENHDGSKWVGVDDFKLTYVSSEFPALPAAAEGKMNAEVAAAQTAAIEAYNAEKSVANYNAAAAAIAAASESARIYADNKIALDAQKALMDATNVYDAAGFAAYNSAYEAALAAYEDGTATEAVVNPTAATGWHASTEYNFLLTPWTIGGEACNNFDKALYLNTWSVEGNGDGSNFTTPFFEYWVSDENSLGDNTISAKVEGVENGIYTVSAWVRVRATNGVDATEATGITLSANGSDPIDATEGAQVGGTQFTIAEVEVADVVVNDGTLTINFNVEDANISWLSFKNVKYTKTANLPTTDVELAVTEAKYSTFIAPFDAKLPDGVKAYTVDGIGYGNELVMTEISSIQANTPVVLFSETQVSETLTGVSMAEAATYTVGLLTGVYAPVEITDGYVLQNHDEKGVKFYKVSKEDAITVPANKAYLTTTSEAKALDFPTATAIEAINALANGNVEGIYNAAGAKQNGLQKGINIMKMANGKSVKVMVK